MTPQQQALLREIVWVDPDRLGGMPCFRGTRVPIQTLIDHIEGNSTLEEFLAGFPSVSVKRRFSLLSWRKTIFWRAYPDR